jgi:hypothetical protein
MTYGVKNRILKETSTKQNSKTGVENTIFWEGGLRAIIEVQYFVIFV